MSHRLKDLPPATPIDFDAMPQRRRPKIVTFVGWCCAGVGYASFFLKGSQLPSYFFPETLKKYVNPEWNPPQLTRAQFTIAALVLFAEMAVALVCMVGGIGCLKMREWGRRALLVYCVLTVLVTIAKTVWQIQNFDFMLDYQISVTTRPVDRTLEGNREFFFLVMSSAMQMLWPFIVGSILTRRYVKDAFDRVRLGGASSDGWQSN